MQIELSKDEIITLKSVLNDRIYILERLSNYKKLTLNQKSRLNEMKNILNKLNNLKEV
jgi:hypothetical protein